MKRRLIKTEADYETALAHVEALMDAAPDSNEEDDLELWSLLVERYEEEKYPECAPDPVDV